MQILIATRNKGKLREISRLLEDLPYQILTPDNFQNLPDVLEDGQTFEENAEKKAATLAGESGAFTIADDSGLVVDFLGGRPGVYSARYAGEPVNDKANCRKLLQELDGIPRQRMAAMGEPAHVEFPRRQEAQPAGGPLAGTHLPW